MELQKEARVPEFSSSVPKFTENNWLLFRRKMAVAMHGLGLGAYLELQKYIPIDEKEEEELKEAMTAKEYKKYLIIAKRKAYTLLNLKIDGGDAESLIRDAGTDIKSAWDALCAEYNEKIVQDRRLLKVEFFKLKLKKGGTLAQLKSSIQQEAKLINTTYDGNVVGITQEDQLAALLAGVSGHPQFTSTLTTLRLKQNLTFGEAYKNLRAAELQHNVETKQRSTEHRNHGIYVADHQTVPKQPSDQNDIYTSTQNIACQNCGSCQNEQNWETSRLNHQFDERLNVSQGQDQKWYKARTSYNPTEVCRNFLAGRCFRGNACRFRHQNAVPQQNRVQGNRTPFCLRCQSSGDHHTRDCPENLTLNQRLNSQNSFNRASVAVCSNCRRPGHTRSECRTNSLARRAQNIPPNAGNRLNPRNQGPPANGTIQSRAHMSYEDEPQTALQHSTPFNTDFQNENLNFQQFDNVPQISEDQYEQNLWDHDQFVDQQGIYDTYLGVSYALNSSQPQHINLPRNTWILDGGATSHVCNNLKIFDQTSLKDVHVKIGGFNNNSSAIATKRGTAVIMPRVGDETCPKQQVLLTNTLFTETARLNLISESRLDAAGFVITTANGVKTVLNPQNKTVMIAKNHHGLYVVQVFFKEQKSDEKSYFPEFIGFSLSPQGTNTQDEEFCLISQTYTGNLNALDLFHRRFAHVNTGYLKQTFHIPGKIKPCFCSSCVKFKSHKQPFTGTNTREYQVREEMGTDMHGPRRIRTPGGARYFSVLLDFGSDYNALTLSSKKSQYTVQLIQRLKNVKHRFGEHIKRLRTDGGGEFVNHKLESFCKSNSIKLIRTAPYSSAQNGRSERKIRTLSESGNSMLDFSGLPETFWGESTKYSNYILNRLPDSKDNYTSCKLDRFDPSVAHKDHLKFIRTFGCAAWVYVEVRRKDTPKSVLCCLLGLDLSQLAYRLYHLIKRKVVFSRNVIFDETHFPYKSGVALRRRVSLTPTSAKKHQSKTGTPLIEPSDYRTLPLAPKMSVESESPKDIVVLDKDATPDETSEIPRYSLRKNPEPSQAFLRQFAHISENVGVEIASFFELAFLAGQSFSFSPSGLTVPKTYKQVLKSPQKAQWVQALNKEMGMMKEYKVWKLIQRSELPPNTPVITCRWVLRIKLDSQNNIDKFKARLVARGFQQEEGVNFEETFAVTAKFKSFRIAAALAALHKIELRHWDVVSAFLNGVCREDIYMEQPPGFEKGGVDSNGKPIHVCKLQKYVYGLKQAGREWGKHFAYCLNKLGFESLKSDEGVFVLHAPTFFCLVVSHVDDMSIGCNQPKFVDQLESKVEQFFKINNLGRMQLFVGVQVSQSPGKISLSQDAYIERALKRFNMENCNPQRTPLSPGLKLRKSDCPVEEKDKVQMSAIPYRSLVGTLMYAAVGTRPEMAYAVGNLSRFLNNPGEPMWRSGKRTLRFLSGTRTAGPTYQVTGNNEIIAFCDSDWGNNPDDRRSVSGHVLLLANAAISWKSRVQQTVALSSVEAEYLALSDCVKEVIWARSFMTELGFPPKNPTKIYIDNTGAEALAKNPVNHQRTKHIDIRHHFIRQHVDDKTIQLVHIASEENVADILTKALPYQSFLKHHEGLIGTRLQNR